MSLVIVESPAKAKTIERYLGGEHRVLASFGHLRDLVAKDGAVLPEEDFAMVWQIKADRTKLLSEITKALKETDSLILATDPDREGEAIAWHLLEALKSRRVLGDKSITRVVFNSITKTAVLEAMANPRDIDEDLVNAYLARRALDYLVGFTLSPVLWRKLPGVKSAGRVQSTALRLICEREVERETFKPKDFWTIDLNLLADQSPLTARLSVLDGTKLEKFTLKDASEAEAARATAEAASWQVSNIETKPVRRHPAPPFTTSTLQQEASRKLGFSATRTMRAAQKLYDSSLGTGFITYMRTDSVQVAASALAGARAEIKTQFGADYVPEKPNYYRTKAKNAQEAHEAVRPTDFSRTPESVKIKGDEGRLYELIWKRAIASQMEQAQFQRTNLTLEGNGSDGLAARATGNQLLFDGFLRVYFEGRDLPETDKEEEDDSEQKLPPLKEGQDLKMKNAETKEHTTQPKPRFTEASLVKQLEALGIGRPSTYAAIMEKLREREYIVMEKKQLVPDSRGRIATEFLKKYFAQIVDYNFTAGMEEQLDDVSAGKVQWREVLRDFWTGFSRSVEAISEVRTTSILDDLNEEMGESVFTEGRTCSLCAKAEREGELSIKSGRYGAFVGCSNYPECNYTRPLSGDAGSSGSEDRTLGTCPDTQQTIMAKNGRFGPYVERALMAGEDKPKRCSLPKGTGLEKIELGVALALLALPRELGKHPDDDGEVVAALGRYGAYVKHGRTSASLGKAHDVTTIDLETALQVLAEKKASPSKGRGGQAAKGKVIGEHPDGGEVQLLKGRYGAYVKWGKINASLKDIEDDDLTLEIALQLITERASKPPPAKTKTRKRTTSAKATRT